MPSPAITSHHPHHPELYPHLGQPKTRSAPAPGGKLGALFDQVAKLPRSQQARIAGTIEDMLLASQARQAS